MVRRKAFDVSEMAIVTYLIAKSVGKSMVLLPAVMTARVQHAWAIYNGDVHAKLTPPELAGKRVGIRSFTTTTGAWLRGMFENDYGLDLSKVKWITFEEPHVAEYVDTTERAPEGKKIVPMLLAGELDAVLGDRSDDPRASSLFGDPEAAAKAWVAKHRIVPLNHFVVVSGELAKLRPDLVEEVYAVLKESRRRAVEAGAAAPADRRRRLPPGARKDHRLRRPAAAHPAPLRGRRAVRRHDAEDDLRAAGRRVRRDARWHGKAGKTDQKRAVARGADRRAAMGGR